MGGWPHVVGGGRSSNRGQARRVRGAGAAADRGCCGQHSGNTSPVREASDAPIADAKLHPMERGDFAPEFPLEWALKDVDLAIGAAGDDELPLLAALSRQWRAAVDAGHGREDISAARLALGGHQQP